MLLRLPSSENLLQKEKIPPSWCFFSWLWILLHDSVLIPFSYWHSLPLSASLVSLYRPHPSCCALHSHLALPHIHVKHKQAAVWIKHLRQCTHWAPSVVSGGALALRWGGSGHTPCVFGCLHTWHRIPPSSGGYHICALDVLLLQKLPHSPFSPSFQARQDSARVVCSLVSLSHLWFVWNSLFGALLLLGRQLFCFAFDPLSFRTFLTFPSVLAAPLNVTALEAFQSDVALSVEDLCRLCSSLSEHVSVSERGNTTVYLREA